MVSRWALIVAVVACNEPKKAAPPPPPAPPPPVDAAIVVDAPPPIDAIAIDAALDPGSKPGSVEAKIAAWWQEVGEGDPTKHAARGFVIEAFVPADIFTGQTCANKPYVTDSPRAGDECLRLAVINHRPPAWRAGWGCKGFSGSDLAKKTKSEREASKDILRCGNRSNAGVFVAVDATGNVTALLVNVADSR